MDNCKISEALAVLGAINPSSQAAGTVTSGWISLSEVERVLAVIQTGTFGASATVDANVQQAQDGTGTGAKAITGKAITELAAAGGGNQQATIDVRQEELDVANGFGYIQLSIIVGVAATETAGLVLGGGARYQPASLFNATSVAQQV